MREDERRRYEENLKRAGDYGYSLMSVEPRVLHTLRPIGVAMAGRDTRDPYKD